MSIQPGANLYTIAFGNRPENVEVPHIETRAPTSADVNYPLGKRWVFINNGEYTLTGITITNNVGSANWALLGTNSGALNTLTGNSGGAITPAAGNINIVGTGPISVAGAGSTLTISFSGGTAAVATMTGDTGTATPSGGNIKLAGTMNEITTAASGATITFTIPATFVAPGSIASTTTITAATGLTVSAGGAAITGTTTINTTGAATTTIGTGGTGAVAIGNATGNTSVTGTLTTSGNLTVSAGGATITGTTAINATGAATTTIGTGGTGAVNIGNATGNTAVTGSLTTTTTLTATLGAITASNGNLSLATAGNKIIIATGANASVGTSAAMGGTPGTVTVATTASSATAKIFYARATAGGTLGNVSITAQDGTGFTLTSTANETSTFNWWIINA